MKEPVDHIARPILPWRTGKEGAITECGYDVSKVKTLTREEFFQRVKDLGQQRMAMLTCMTCSDTARRWKAWEDDPRQAMNREIEWEYGGGYRARTDRGERLKDDLVAIAALIENHREEFETTITTNEQRREWLEKKAAHKTQKSATPPPRPPNSIL
jgi:hypothetical protein